MVYPSLVLVRLALRLIWLLPCSRSLQSTSLSLRLRLLTSTPVRQAAQQSLSRQSGPSLVLLRSPRSSHLLPVLLLTVLPVSLLPQALLLERVLRLLRRLEPIWSLSPVPVVVILTVQASSRMSVTSPSPSVALSTSILERQDLPSRSL